MKKERRPDEIAPGGGTFRDELGIGGVEVVYRVEVRVAVGFFDVQVEGMTGQVGERDVDLYGEREAVSFFVAEFVSGFGVVAVGYGDAFG